MNVVQEALRVIGIINIAAGVILGGIGVNGGDLLLAFYGFFVGPSIGVLFLGFNKAISLLSDIRDSLRESVRP
jgi:hypothetical protein